MAKDLAKKYKTKASLENALIKSARRPLNLRAYALPGGGFVTNEIRLPDNWNELVASLGYEPIENFYINGTFNKKGTL